jgi:RNA polymerase sigma-70 factor (ECF subfamily)
MDDMAPPARDVPPYDEAALLPLLRTGDGAAFESFVRRFSGQLLQVARRVLGNEDDAREAVQDGFLAAFRGIGGFDGRSRLATWLHRIVLNAALTKLRHRRRSGERSIEDLLPHFGDGEHDLSAPAPWRPASTDPLQQQELRELVRRAIDGLPEIYRTVLVLRDVEELDTGEAARLLGTSTTVVKTRLHRARQALRTLLDPHLRGDLP